MWCQQYIALSVHHKTVRISIRHSRYFLFCHTFLRLLFESGYYSRVAFIKLSALVQILCKCKGFEKCLFYKVNKELRCSDMVLKQNFQLLDQLLLSNKLVLTWHLQCWSPSVPQKIPNLAAEIHCLEEQAVAADARESIQRDSTTLATVMNTELEESDPVANVE